MPESVIYFVMMPPGVAEGIILALSRSRTPPSLSTVQADVKLKVMSENENQILIDEILKEVEILLQSDILSDEEKISALRQVLHTLENTEGG